MIQELNNILDYKNCNKLKEIASKLGLKLIRNLMIMKKSI